MQIIFTSRRRKDRSYFRNVGNTFGVNTEIEDMKKINLPWGV